MLLPAHAAEPVGTPRLTVIQQDWGNPSKGKSVLDTPLRIGAETFSHGIGTHANSIMVLDLPHPATRFQAKIGVDANPDTEKGQGKSSVVFMVIAGNKELYRSPVLRTEMGAVAVDVPLKGVTNLQLRVTDAGDGIGFDQADWAAASITMDQQDIKLEDMTMEDKRAEKVAAPAMSLPPPMPLPDEWVTAVATNARVPHWRRADVRRVRLEGEWGRRQTLTAATIAAEDPSVILGRLNHGSKGNMYLGLGKLVDAMARFAAIPGAAPAVQECRKNYLEGIFAAQSEDGYVGGWPTTNMLAKSGQWEVHELTYLIYGLCQDYRLHGDKRSLDAAQRAGDYLLGHLQPLNVHCKQGLIGLDQCLVALWVSTGEERWREALLARVAPARWMPADRAPHGHFYEHLSVCVGQMDYCENAPDPDRLRHGWRLLEHLGPGGGLLINGSSSNKEHVDSSHASGVAVETCATAYLIRTLGRIFELTGDVRCHEIIERAVNNAFFAAQTPDGKTIRYFTRHEGERGSGGPYVCCKMNFRRTMAELGEYVAYAGSEGVAVCQYVPGKMDLDMEGGGKVALEVVTAYPDDGVVTIRVRPDQTRAFALRLRLPAWCKQPTVQVNNEAPMKELHPGKWAVILRDWTGNETVRLELPMTWRWVAGRAKQTGRAALMRGPLVYHLDPARSGESVRTGVLDLVQPDSLAVGEPQPDTALHPAGRITRVRQRAEADGSLDAKSDELVFVPYADPGGRRLWFEMPGNPDEIVSGFEKTGESHE
jgi:hypothetical protein